MFFGFSTRGKIDRELSLTRVQRRDKSFVVRNRNQLLRVFTFRDAPHARALEQAIGESSP